MSCIWKPEISPGAELEKQSMELGENSTHGGWHMQNSVDLKPYYILVPVNEE